MNKSKAVKSYFCINSNNHNAFLKGYMCLVQRIIMDICLITIDNNLNKSLQPKSAIGMLWLQTHFENDQWEALSNSTVIISEENSQLLIEDATNAGLNIKCFSDISMLDVFPKNN